MKTIEYNTEDGSMKIRLEFKTFHPYTYYGGIGKCWPTTTQCLLFVNDMLINSGKAVKHIKDEENPKLAAMVALKKALVKLNLKFIRKHIWNEFHKIDF